MHSTIKEERKGQLDAFLALAIEPLPAVELVDFEYNALAREARQEAWNKASLTTSFYKAYRATALAAECLAEHHDTHMLREGSDPRIIYHSCIDMWRKAVADQLLTPAHQKLDIAWKKKQDLRYLPVDADVVARAIAADEAFLAGHPLRRSDVGGL